MAATPYLLLQGLVDHVLENKLTDITLMQLHTERSEMPRSSRIGRSPQKPLFLCQRSNAKSHQRRKGGLRPHFSFGNPQVVPPTGTKDRCCFDPGFSTRQTRGMQPGVSVEATLAAIEVSTYIIAQVNPQMPRSHGDGFIALTDIDVIFEQESEIRNTHPLNWMR